MPASSKEKQTYILAVLVDAPIVSHNSFERSLMALLVVGGHKVNEDSYRFPSPDLTIQSVTRKEALKSLGVQGMKQGHGIVYFYIDRGYKENNVIYIGESGNSIQSRHNATHSKAKWFSALRYPLIGVVQSPYRRWDTDTRRAIEAQIVYELRQSGFNPFNHENSTWRDGVDFNIYDEPAYLSSVVDHIVEYILFHLGIEKGDSIGEVSDSIDVLSSTQSTSSTLSSISVIKPLSNSEAEMNTQIKVKASDLWNNPIQGRKLKAERGGCTVYGEQQADGKVVVYQATNINLEHSPSLPEKALEERDAILLECVPNKTGRLDWSGRLEFSRPSVPLTRFFGSPCGNLWVVNDSKEEEELSSEPLESAFDAESPLKEYDQQPKERKNDMGNHLWKTPIDGRELFFFRKKYGIKVYAKQCADGQVVLTSVENLPFSCADYASPSIQKRHAKLISEAFQDENGQLNWVGETEPAPPSIWLSAAVGTVVAKQEWKEVDSSR